MLFATGLSTTSTIALAVMAGIFIGFALLSSFVFPKRNPDFPGKKLRWVYVAASIGLFLLMMSTVIVFGKEDEEARAQETASANENNFPPQYRNGDAAAGKALFASKGCGVCHTLKAAGSTGTVGPNLDEKKPPEALIVDRLLNGKGAMPPFKSQLTDKQIADLVAYVHESTQSS
jgi:sulfite dehydrogenase